MGCDMAFDRSRPPQESHRVAANGAGCPLANDDHTPTYCQHPGSPDGICRAPATAGCPLSKMPLAIWRDRLEPRQVKLWQDEGNGS